jgi:hypothetical protein
MVRIPVVFICTVLISSAVVALPRSAVSDRPTLAVRVEETSESRAIPDACRNTDESPPWCAPYSLRLQEQEHQRPERRAAPLAKPKPAPSQVTAAAKPARNAAAGRLLSEQERNAIAPRPLTPSATGPVKAGILGKTPEEKLRHMIGQLMLTGFSGQQPGDPDVERLAGDLRSGKLVGALVRDSNIESSRQLRGLLESIADAAGEHTPLIAIEQPGGPDTVMSEDKGFTFHSSANAVSSSGNPHEAQVEYRAMADELAGLGVTLNIGPSEDACRRQGVDLSALCFGTSPALIAVYARAFKFGHHDRGVLAALRHVPFRPGLRTTWLKERPSSAMMHLLSRSEPSDALVISVKAMESMRYLDVSLGLARTAKARGSRGNFHDALIFEMDMPGGAPALYGETVVRALLSGADMILVREPSTLPAGITALSFEAVQAALKSGRLQMARIEDAYRHAQTLKARLQSLPARAKTAGLERDSVSERVSTSQR